MFVSFSSTHLRFFEDASEVLGKNQLFQIREYFDRHARDTFLQKVKRSIFAALLVVSLPIFKTADYLSEGKFSHYYVISLFAALRSASTLSESARTVQKIYSQKLLALPILPLLRQLSILASLQADLQEINPRLVVFADDTTYGVCLHAIQACRRLGYRTIVLPFTNGVASEYVSDAVTSRGTDRIQRALSNFIFPQYRWEHEGTHLSFPLRCTINAAYFNMSADQLWLNHSDEADYYAYYNEFDFRLAKSVSTTREKLFLIEPPQATRAYQLMETLVPSTDSSAIEVLVLLPPNQFPIKSEFGSYENLLRTYLQPFADARPPNLKFLVSIHPRGNMLRIKTLLTEMGSHEIVPSVPIGLARAQMVVSYGSSLNAVVEHMGLPLLTYNIYGFDNMTPKQPGPNTTVADHHNYQKLAALLLAGGHVGPARRQETREDLGEWIARILPS